MKKNPVALSVMLLGLVTLFSFYSCDKKYDFLEKDFESEFDKDNGFVKGEYRIEIDLKGDLYYLHPSVFFYTHPLDNKYREEEPIYSETGEGQFYYNIKPFTKLWAQTPNSYKSFAVMIVLGNNDFDLEKEEKIERKIRIAIRGYFNKKLINSCDTTISLEYPDNTSLEFYVRKGIIKNNER